MAVYVDPITEYPLDVVAPAARKHGGAWCHLVADTVPELMAFARKIGLKGGWVQRGGIGKRIIHFDLTPGMRAKAVKAGAVELDSIGIQKWVKKNHPLPLFEKAEEQKRNDR